MGGKTTKADSRQDIQSALRERMKELNCLYSIARIAELNSDSMDGFLQGVVDVLPMSWQYPAAAVARIRYGDRVYTSKRFVASKTCQRASVRVSGQMVGEVEVYYRRKCPASDEGPFLKEERALIEAVSERIGETLTRMSGAEELAAAHRELRANQRELENANAALRTVLKQIQVEKADIEHNVQTNLRTLITPVLDRMEMEGAIPCRKHVALLRKTISQLVYPNARGLRAQYPALTPTEIQICNMIANGLRTKEIAELRKVSLATIHRHRERIRKKLGLTGSGANLASRLAVRMSKT